MQNHQYTNIQRLVRRIEKEIRMDKRESSTKFDFNFGSEDLDIKEPKKQARFLSIGACTEESHKKTY